MTLAYTKQSIQDWITQQWVILTGKQINLEENSWLMGPFGNLNGIGENFIYQLAEEENLIVQRNLNSSGLLHSIDQLGLSQHEKTLLSKEVIDFYESTSNYNLDLNVKWNPFYQIFGVLLNHIFSHRINQLNIPTKTVEKKEHLKSEIITLINPKTQQVLYTFWLRSKESTGQVIYSGIYSTCILPSGTACVKAVFPLPKGNATVIMIPSIEKNGELKLNSSGNQFGDAGFYFILKDRKGKIWSKFIRSFRDQLVIGMKNGELIAQQKLTLWNQKIVNFSYSIKKKQ
jgi:hypothetical protein